MNRVKFRPVGRPNGPVVIIKVTQSRAAIQRENFPRLPSLAAANREMLRRGFVRC